MRYTLEGGPHDGLTLDIAPGVLTVCTPVLATASFEPANPDDGTGYTTGGAPIMTGVRIARYERRRWATGGTGYGSTYDRFIYAGTS